MVLSVLESSCKKGNFSGTLHETRTEFRVFKEREFTCKKLSTLTAVSVMGEKLLSLILIAAYYAHTQKHRTWH